IVMCLYYVFYIFFFFFLSSRRRHTRCLSDWSSDVCSSDLDRAGSVLIHLGNEQFLERYKVYMAHVQEWRQQFHKLKSVDLRYERSEERRVGKESRYRGEG